MRRWEYTYQCIFHIPYMRIFPSRFMTVSILKTFTLFPQNKVDNAQNEPTDAFHIVTLFFG